MISILSEDGHPIVSLQYKDEKTFRNQTKHVIKKINSVTKKLGDLNVGVVPELKLTYVPGVPDDYQPNYFLPGSGTYNFGHRKPFLYNYGYISSVSTAIAFQLKSIYLDKDKINDLEDVLYDDVGILDKQYVDPKDVSGDVFTDEEESPSQIPQSPSPMEVEVPRSEGVFKHLFLVDQKSSKAGRTILKSPDDQLVYE
uniref:HORMA domain-containing protein n=1 Tax=Meloidogyne hapla TaxID=6305 RepID=A0A1I8B2R8_MELHA